MSLLTLGWIAVGAQRALALGQMKHMPLPTSVDGCPAINGTTIAPPIITPR